MGRTTGQDRQEAAMSIGVTDGHAGHPEHAGYAEKDVRELYHAMLEGWDTRNAQAMADTFAEDGEVVGFDGSRHTGRAAIAADMAKIFTGHATPTYVAKVRKVRLMGSCAALLEAATGLVPAGGSDLRPELNAWQTVVAARQEEGAWRILLLQNTPARFHGRPDLAESFTQELRDLLLPTFDY
jgi:uncharacterized protein (TIGR02246 family)